MMPGGGEGVAHWGETVCSLLSPCDRGTKSLGEVVDRDTVDVRFAKSASVFSTFSL